MPLPKHVERTAPRVTPKGTRTRYKVPVRVRCEECVILMTARDCAGAGGPGRPGGPSPCCCVPNTHLKNDFKEREKGAWLAWPVEQGTHDKGQEFKPHTGYRDDLKIKKRNSPRKLLNVKEKLDSSA